MQFTMTFKMDNAAFSDEPATEAARLLLQAAEAVEDGYESGDCIDINGNRVGQWEVKE